MSSPNPPSETTLPAQAVRLAPRLKALANRGVYFGTSSWKYPGWVGSIYSPSLYETRGKFSEAKFDRECLPEYARTFPIVGGDFSFYRFPEPSFWERTFTSAPDLKFALKVPENITVETWPKHARYGQKVGLKNDLFLSAKAFADLFIRPLEPYADQVAAHVFEFGTLPKSAFATPKAFTARLDTFLGELPSGFRYSIEIRNKDYLGDDYFEVLSRHNVAHVFNAWTRMPELGDQIELPGAFTADFTVVRALLAHGRGYEQGVDSFEPFDRVQAPNERAREALAKIGKRSLEEKRAAFILVNNRLEGNAPTTIESVVDVISLA